MGGYGSGRIGSGKPKAESLKRLNLTRMSREGSLRPGTVSKLSWSLDGTETGSIALIASATGLRLIYQVQTTSGPCRDIDEMVQFGWTKPKFGGRRQWFHCPGCQRHCLVLFAVIRFRCRHCHQVRYSSQSETRSDRANRAMQKIVRRLDPTREYNELPPKPHGMHWHTYERFAERYDSYDNQWGAEVMLRFGIL